VEHKTNIRLSLGVFQAGFLGRFIPPKPSVFLGYLPRFLAFLYRYFVNCSILNHMHWKLAKNKITYSTKLQTEEKRSLLYTLWCLVVRVIDLIATIIDRCYWLRTEKEISVWVAYVDRSVFRESSWRLLHLFSTVICFFETIVLVKCLVVSVLHTL